VHSASDVRDPFCSCAQKLTSLLLLALLSSSYVIISLTKISVDSFALPMMASVEEAGESQFGSRQGSGRNGATSGGVEKPATTDALTGGSPLNKDRRFGADAINEDREDDHPSEHSALIQQRAKNADLEAALGIVPMPGVDVSHVRPVDGVPPTHDQVVASMTRQSHSTRTSPRTMPSAGGGGDAGGSPATTLLGASIATPTGNITSSSSSHVAGSIVAPPGASPASPFTPDMNSHGAPPVIIHPPVVAASTAKKTSPHMQPYTHVPLQPSTLPSTTATLIPLDGDIDRPPSHLVQKSTGERPGPLSVLERRLASMSVSNGGSSGGSERKSNPSSGSPTPAAGGKTLVVAREQFPNALVGNARAPRRDVNSEHSSTSSGATFSSENAILEIRYVGARWSDAQA
jgi:hypothetical protein